MVREFTLPDVGEGVTEGELVSWLVAVGDEVTEDQSVAEVETDKALVEVPSPVDGIVRERRAEEGEIVPVGEVIITFDVEGEDGDGEDADSDDANGEDGESTGDRPGAPGATGAEAETERAGTPAGRVFAPPRVRRLARERDVDLEQVRGSGPGGRVTEADVRAASDEAAATDDVPERTTTSEQETETEGDSRTAPEGEPESASSGRTLETTPSLESSSDSAATESADRDRTLAAPATRRLAEEEGIDLNAVPTTERRDGEAFVTPEAVREYAAAQREAQTADAAAVSESTEDQSGARTARERGERIPYRGVRKAIGDQMERSKYTAPHVTHVDEIDVTELVEMRTRLKERASERGIRLTYVPFVMRAVVAALAEHPMVNSQLDEENEEIVTLDHYNVGVATATDAGLVVPVVEDVDRKGLLQLASELDELVTKARDRSISLEEMRGGTFTITNVGGIGGRFATPIINYPEVAILALGSIEERPWVVDGDVVPRHVLPLSLSFDHRVIDGAVAARFTNTLAEYLHDPTLLLLE